MLARSYTMLGRRAEAVTAYERAVALQEGDASLLADYADALAVTRESRLAGEPAALVERALKLDPNHAKALSLAGTAAFERKDYAGAVARWEHLLEVAPPDSPFVEPMRANIAQARELGGLAATSAPASATGPGKLVAAGGGSVSGTVRLAAAAAAKASPEDTVFVFARAAGGSRMPLAILRKQVKDLPLDFRLDDSMAMSPSTKLSSAAKVVVGARLSKSGDAMPQAGDWTGQSDAVALGATGLRIEISKPAGQ
jgi:cytochrome c-type biogenesis protein CcmH